MKSATTFSLIPLVFFAVLLCLTPRQSRAQDFAYEDSSAPYSRAELAQLLAPIALYPDALLAQVLMASTYPIEVIEAERWVRMNPGLRDAALDAALLDKPWDPSVKALCHFPTVLALMSEKIGPTTDLGNAFLAQEAEVMAMVQELRAAAYAQGNLTSSATQRVIVEREVLLIQPTNPRVIYVPYYDPFWVYGPWWYPAYPPYYWGPSGVSLGYAIGYWPGVSLRFTFGSWSYLDWRRHQVILHVHQRPAFVRHHHWVSNSGPWRHSPAHRRGVAYGDRSRFDRDGREFSRPTETRRDVRGTPSTRPPQGERRLDQRRDLERTPREHPRTRLDSDHRRPERTPPAGLVREAPRSTPAQPTPRRMEGEPRDQRRINTPPREQPTRQVERARPQRVERDQRPGNEVTREASPQRRDRSAPQVEPRREFSRGESERIRREEPHRDSRERVRSGGEGPQRGERHGEVSARSGRGY
ncbi:DUF3300 domain-containing protein [Geoalkalibacter sp.]|uniref:DUF3300 domain-containing protein n=1 Tax=Geoalkalibacter sp. TaxID=3041440 RepID=UPI00272DE165|nr:DUF3300 domain-containing protein [Geoalkalibacter sp.]